MVINNPVLTQMITFAVTAFRYMRRSVPLFSWHCEVADDYWRNLRTSGLILWLAVLCSCSVGPNYQAPKMQLPAEFARMDRAQFLAGDVQVDWWTLFHDSQLINLVDAVIRHNYDLAAARANLQQARLLYLEAGLSLLPTIGSRANYYEQKRSTAALNNRSFVPRELKLYNMGFDATWELDIFGRVQRNMEASHDLIEAEQSTLKDLEVSLIAELSRNYFEWLGLQHQLAIFQDTIANQEKNLTLVQARLAHGIATEQDVNQAEQQLEHIKSSVPSLESAISQAIHRLSVLTGQVPGSLLSQLNTARSLPQAPEKIQVGDPGQLLQRRQDIRIAERTLAAATAKIGVVTADLFPRVSLVGSLSLEANTLSNMVAPGSEAYSIGPQIRWAAFDLGRVYSRIKAAGAGAEASLALYQQTVLNALEETENSLVNYRQELVRRQALSAAEKASSHAAGLARLRHQEGVIDLQGVLDAERQWLQDQSQLAQSETVAATALIAVYKALGGGW